MSLQELIVEHGYLALFVGTFLEGETILIIAGYLAQGGLLELPWVVLSAFLGSFLGDQTFFFLGRWKGIRFLDKRPAWRRNSQRAFALLNRHKLAVVLGFRFLYGIRNVTPFIIGSGGMSPWAFGALNFTGALAWAITFGCAGYNLGTLVETLMADMRRYELIGIASICAIAGTCFLWANLRKK